MIGKYDNVCSSIPIMAGGFMLMLVSYLLRASIDHGTKFRITLIFPRSDTCWRVPSTNPAMGCG